MNKIKEEDRKRLQRNKQLDIKFERSQKVVGDFKKNQEHKLMLAQEERKLNEQAMDALKVRQSRLDKKKKMEIMQKEKRAEENISAVKATETMLKEQRPVQLFKISHDRNTIQSELDQWA